MAKKTKGLLAAAMAFAATPQGRLLLAQAKDYATRPETKQKAQALLSQASQARAKRKAGTKTSARFTDTPVRSSETPRYGTPPQP